MINNLEKVLKFFVEKGGNPELGLGAWAKVVPSNS
jgi:hypothetical protein